MSNLQQSSKQYFRQLNLVFIAFLLGQLLFLGVCVLLNADKPKTEDATFDIVVPIIVVGGILASAFLYRILIGKARQEPELKSKMKRYSSAFIIRCAFVEGPCLFSIVVFLLTAERSMLLYTAACLVVFIANRPSRAKVIDDLELEGTDKQMVEDPEAIIAEVSPLKRY